MQFNPGPPFAIGDIVLCDVEEFGLQKRCVTRADHPSYIICLDNGHVVDTAETPAGLIQSYAEWEGNTNNFAPYVEPPIFAKLWSETSQLGLFGVQIDTQCKALHLVDLSTRMWTCSRFTTHTGRCERLLPRGLNERVWK